MTKDTSISLSDRHAAFIEARVQSGDYASASDVVRGGLTLLEEHQAEYEAKLKALHRALDEGEASGIAPWVDRKQWQAERMAESVKRREAEYHEAKAKYLEAKARVEGKAESEAETETPPIRRSG